MPTVTDFLQLAPEILLAAAGLLLLLAGAIGRGMGNQESAAVALVALGLTAGLVLRVQWGLPGRVLILNNSFVLDGFSFFLKLLVLVATALTVLISIRFLDEGTTAPRSTTRCSCSPRRACCSWPAATRC